MLLLFLVILFITPLQAIQNIECSSASSSNTLSNGEYAFFRSPAFPKTLSNGTAKVYCQTGFQTNSGNYIWLAMYNGVTGGINYGDSSYSHLSSSYNSNYDIFKFSTTSSYLNFQLSQTVNPSWTAFEAIVLSYNPISFCPFAQKNITLVTNMVIPIASDFGSEKIHATCGWTFIIGANQKLKVVMKQLKVATSFSLTLTTDGNNIASFNSPVTPDYPQIHYYESNSGIFQFTMNNANSTNANFLAFISMVEITTAPNNRICNNQTSLNNYVSVFNLNYEMGYDAFDSCQYILSIPANKELLLHVDNFFIEENADILILTNNSYQLTLNNMSYYHLMQNFDNSVIHFSADGNTQQAGFSLHYNIIDCKCADVSFVVPCQGGTLYPTTNDELYCSNQNCNYTIIKDSSCPYDHFTLKLNLKIRDSLDFINVYLNGQFNEKLTTINFNRKAYSFNSNPLFEFQSGSIGNGTTNFENSWSIDVNYGDAPNTLLAHNLTTANPTYVTWLDDMNFNDAVTVCAPSGNTLEMFLSSEMCDGDLSNYGLYDDSQNLENFVFNLDSSNICSQNTQKLLSKTSSSGCFTLYKLNTTAPVNTTILFRLKEVHSKNCLNADNVVKVFVNNETSFSASATSAGSCEFTILSSAISSPIFGASFSQFTSSSDAIYRFKSPINQKHVLNLNSSEFLYYLPLYLYTPAISIIIPYGRTLNFNAATFTNKIRVTSARAVLASPNYYGFSKSFDRYLYVLDPQNVYGNFNFVVKEINQLSVYVHCYQYYNNDYYYYFKENDNVTLTNCYSDFYAETDSLDKGFLIDFAVPNAYIGTYGTSSAQQSTTRWTPTNTVRASTTTSRRSSTVKSTTTSSSAGHKLSCLSDYGPKTCSTNDYFCVYLAGTYEGSYVEFQGCSLDLAQQIDTTVCTNNVFTHGTTDGDTYTLQCCDTNNCNTGKSGTHDTGDNGGNGNRKFFTVGFSLFFVYINNFFLKFL